MYVGAFNVLRVVIVTCCYLQNRADAVCFSPHIGSCFFVVRVFSCLRSCKFVFVSAYAVIRRAALLPSVIIPFPRFGGSRVVVVDLSLHFHIGL